MSTNLIWQIGTACKQTAVKNVRNALQHPIHTCTSKAMFAGFAIWPTPPNQARGVKAQTRKIVCIKHLNYSPRKISRYSRIFTDASSSDQVMLLSTLQYNVELGAQNKPVNVHIHVGCLGTYVSAAGHIPSITLPSLQ